MKETTSSIYNRSMNRRAASLYVQSTGCQKCAPGYGWGPGVRDHFLLSCVVSGKGVYECRDRRYELKSDDVFLVYPDTSVRYAADERDPWECVWVGFGGPDAKVYVEQTDLTLSRPVLGGGGELHRLMMEVCESGGVSVWEELEKTARLYSLLSYLIRSSQRRKEGDGAPDCAQLAAAYIVDHYEEPITVEGLAAYASVSHSSLYRRFVKRFGISPKRFLLEYRIGRACELLLGGGYSIQEISNSVGFEDPFYFSRAFKDVKGLSPRQYAAMNRGGE